MERVRPERFAAGTAPPRPRRTWADDAAAAGRLPGGRATDLGHGRAGRACPPCGPPQRAAAARRRWCVGAGALGVVALASGSLPVSRVVTRRPRIVGPALPATRARWREDGHPDLDLQAPSTSIDHHAGAADNPLRPPTGAAARCRSRLIGRGAGSPGTDGAAGLQVNPSSPVRRPPAGGPGRTQTRPPAPRPPRLVVTIVLGSPRRRRTEARERMNGQPPRVPRAAGRAVGAPGTTKRQPRRWSPPGQGRAGRTRPVCRRWRAAGGWSRGRHGQAGHGAVPSSAGDVLVSTVAVCGPWRAAREGGPRRRSILPGPDTGEQRRAARVEEHGPRAGPRALIPAFGYDCPPIWPRLAIAEARTATRVTIGYF